MSVLTWACLLAPIAVGAYAYAAYPVLLSMLPSRRVPTGQAAADAELPLVSVSLPARNEARQIRGALDALLASDYPPDRLQIVVISDASDDGTDEIVGEYASRGVELVRLQVRAGKTAAEQAALPCLRGELIVNTDASIRVEPAAIRKLVAEFADPTVGVASGSDVSVSVATIDRNRSEATYVGYEMAIRALETRVGGIVGASGCLYAIRAHLHQLPLPEHLSRDFASALTAREHGFRAVSVQEATCVVPRTGSLRREYRRKVRTVARGLQTLWHKRRLLNTFRYGTFAWMLWSHKVARWAVPPALLVAFLTLAVLAFSCSWARWGIGLSTIATLAFTYAIWQPDRVPQGLTTLAAALVANVAVLHAALIAPFERSATWEPTRREALHRRAGEDQNRV